MSAPRVPPICETAPPRQGGRAFWPGTVKVCLALAGIVWGFGWGPRRWTGFCTTVLVLGFWLSFGPGDGGPSLHRLPLVWRSLAVLLLGALAAMEIRPTQQHLLPIPNLEAQLPWLAWVESETSPGDALAYPTLPTRARRRGLHGNDAMDVLADASPTPHGERLLGVLP